MVVDSCWGLSQEIADSSREGLVWVWICPGVFRRQLSKCKIAPALKNLCKNDQPNPRITNQTRD